MDADAVDANWRQLTKDLEERLLASSVGRARDGRLLRLNERDWWRLGKVGRVLASSLDVVSRVGRAIDGRLPLLNETDRRFSIDLAGRVLASSVVGDFCRGGWAIGGLVLLLNETDRHFSIDLVGRTLVSSVGGLSGAGCTSCCAKMRLDIRLARIA